MGISEETSNGIFLYRALRIFVANVVVNASSRAITTEDRPRPNMKLRSTYE